MKIRLNLSAFVRLEHSVVEDFPDKATDDDIRKRLVQLADELGIDDYKQDYEYWDQGSANFNKL